MSHTGLQHSSLPIFAVPDLYLSLHLHSRIRKDR